VGVIGDVYGHDEGDRGTRLRATGTRARWTQDGRLDVIDAEEQPPSVPTGREGPAEPARTETERTLAVMLAEALELPEVGRNDNFFGLGGDSILAVQLAARARDCGIPLTARMVFEHPTIHDLAATVDDADADAGAMPHSADSRHEPMAASGLSADELAAVTALFSSAGPASQDGEP
jgi:mycobactin peptide synthetase MbtE